MSHCTLVRMKTNPAVHVSESRGQQADAHVTRPMWWLFRGKPLTRKCCNLVYFETWGPWKHAAPRWNVSPDRSRVYCWKAPGCRLWLNMFYLQRHLHLTSKHNLVTPHLMQGITIVIRVVDASEISWVIVDTVMRTCYWTLSVTLIYC